jgi:hypothetical protein
MDRLSVIENDIKIIKEEQSHIKSVIHLLRGQVNYLLSKIIQYESSSDSDSSDSDSSDSDSSDSDYSDYSTNSEELFNYLDNVNDTSP